jgi:plasmid stability protein
MISMIALLSIWREVRMAAITIRNLDDALKTRLRVRAASHDRSMEEEARSILRAALQEEDKGLGTLIHERFLRVGGAELNLPDRTEAPRKPGKFE